jgi:hypothetical protein
VATALFIKEHAVPGNLATLTGIVGGAHAGFGKGVGGLAGGIIIEGTKNTKVAFYYFGLYSFACSGVLLMFLAIGKLFFKKNIKAKPKIPDDEDNAEPFIANGTEKKIGEGDGKEVEGGALRRTSRMTDNDMVVAVKINTTNLT